MTACMVGSYPLLLVIAGLKAERQGSTKGFCHGPIFSSDSPLNHKPEFRRDQFQPGFHTRIGEQLLVFLIQHQADKLVINQCL
jgi:hypothetical protein